MPIMDIQDIVKKAGGTKHVSTALGLTYQAVHKWESVPSKHVWRVAQMAGMSPEDVRPELFTPAERVAELRSAT